MKILVDTNILLDALLKLVDSGQVIAYVTATTLTDVFYIIRRQTKQIHLAQQAIRTILQTLEIAGVERVVLEHALEIELEDFEDGVQAACAIEYQVDGIVTRDKTGFLTVDVPSLTVSELQQLLTQSE